MTLEELKKIAMCYAHDELKDNCSPIEVVVAGAFMSGIDYIQHNPGWISVDEGLPENEQRVLISDKEDNIWAGVYIAHDDYGFCSPVTWGDSYTIHHDITHWMPLPQLPKKGGEE